MPEKRSPEARRTLSDWTYSVDNVQRIVFVVDIGHTYTKSVTNDIEAVVEALVEECGDLSGYEVLYRDSQERWDGVKVVEGRFAGFYPGHVRERSLCSFNF